MATWVATFDSAADGYVSRDSAGTASLSRTNSFMRFGSKWGLESAMRIFLYMHDVQIDRGRKITAAPLVLTWTGNNALARPTFIAGVRAIDNAQAPTSAEGVYNWAIGTQQNYGRTPTNNSAGDKRTYDIAPLIQYAVDRPGWVKGNGIAIAIWALETDSSTGGYQYASTDHSTASYRPELTVTHVAAINAVGDVVRTPLQATGSGSSEGIDTPAEGAAELPELQVAGDAAQTKQYLVLAEGAAELPELITDAAGLITEVLHGAYGTLYRPLLAHGDGGTQNYEVAAEGGGTLPEQHATGSGTVPPKYLAAALLKLPKLLAEGAALSPSSYIAPADARAVQHIRLLNRSREVLAVLDIASTAAWSRRRNEASEIRVNVPRGDDKLQYTRIATGLEVWENNRRLVSGRISGRNVTDELVELTALTEEVLLEQHVCPINYAQVLANQDLADIARRCLDGWHTLRIGGDWAARRVSSTGVDLNTLPGYVSLARTAGAYVRSGQITLQFSSAEVPRFKDWERVRWSSDFDPPVFTTLQYRFKGPAGWSDWAPRRTVAVGSTSGVGEQGAMPEAMGLYVEAGTADLLEVRLNLYTDDISSQEDGAQTKGVTPLVFGLEAVARTHGHVSAGDIPSATGATVRSVEASHSSALAIMRAACEQVDWEFEVIEGRLNLAAHFGRNRVDDFLLVG